MGKHEGGRSRSRNDNYKKSRSSDDDYKKKDNKHWKGKRKHKKYENNDSDDSGKRKNKYGKGKWKNKKYDDSDSDSDSSDSDSDDDGRGNKRKDKKKKKNSNNNNKKNKKSNDSGSGDGSNDDCDWNIGWIGRKNNDENDDDDKNGNDNGNDKGNGGHCCLWKEISQNPFLRQVNVAVSQYLANNKKAFWSCSSSSSLDVIMADAEHQSNTAWQNKVNNTPGARMLLSVPMGKFIAQALHVYFDPWMDMGILNETYMLVQKDAGAPNSQGIGTYSIHSRRPIFPNGPTDLCVKVENKARTVMIMLYPCDIAEFHCKINVVGGMNFHRKYLNNPIEGFQVVVELDNNFNGACLSLALANLERAWNYVYSSFIKLPQ